MRLRVVVAFVLAAALVGGGLAMERTLGTASPATREPAAAPATSAAFCPHGGGEGWRVWLGLANPGETPIDLRITTASGSADGQASSLTLPPSSFRYVEVAAPITGGATAVESFGGVVAAGMVAAAPEGAGVAAEPCTGTASTRWYLPEASTRRGEAAHVIVHNPFEARAVVDVGLIAGDRHLNPGRLKGVVLGPGEARAFDLHNFALGEGALAAIVNAPLGRVVASALTVSNGGARSVIGVTAPALRRVIPGAGPGGEVVIAAAAGQDAPIHADANGAQGAVPVIDLEAVAAGTAEAFPLAAPDSGVQVTADGPRPMLVGRRMPPPAPAEPPPEEEGKGDDGRKGPGKGDEGGGKKGEDEAEEEEEESAPPATDLAASSGVAAPAGAWVALPATGPDGGPAAVLLQNPGTSQASAWVTFLGSEGPIGEAQEVAIPAGATVAVQLPDGVPAAASVRATAGSLVAAQASLSPGAYAVSVGVRRTTG